jgi:processing peptidase subunit beta
VIHILLGLPTTNAAENKEKATFIGSQITVRDDTMDDVHLTVAFEGVSWSDPDYFAFLVMQQMIGSWDRTIGGGKNLSSHLCEKIAVEGLAKSVTAYNTCYT